MKAGSRKLRKLKQVVLDKIDLEDYYRQRLEQFTRGANGEAKALCPFHDDDDPSLNIDISDKSKQGQYNCFPCKANGDVFTLCARRHHLDVVKDYKDVVKLLARELGIDADAISQLTAIRVSWTPAGAAKLGCEIENWRGYKCMAFPMRDAEGNVTGRKLRRADNKKFPKTKVLPERKAHTPGGSKNGLFYPCPFPKDGEVQVCESETAAITMLSNGARVVVGMPGANPGEFVWGELEKLLAGRKCRLHRDPDKAGAAWQREAKKRLEAVGCKVHIAPSTDKDIDARLAAGEKLSEICRVSGKTPARKKKSKLEKKVEAVEALIPLVSLADIPEREVEWLWHNRIPLGMITTVAGVGGIGKSFWTLDVVARLSTGQDWPDVPNTLQSSAAIIFSIEDDADKLIKPRLRAGRADMTRVFIPEGMQVKVKVKGSEREYFNIKEHMPALEAMLSQKPDVRLLVIDPISAYLGDVNSHNNSEVTAALSPLHELARRYRVAVLLVTHLTKSHKQGAQERVHGSTAFTTVPRMVWLITDARNAGEGRKWLAPVKHNPTKTKPNALQYRIVDDRVTYESELSMTADQALYEDRKAPKRAEARERLRDFLKDGRKRATAVKKLAADAGITSGTLERAKTELDIIPFQDHRVWWWELPSKFDVAMRKAARNPIGKEKRA